MRFLTVIFAFVMSIGSFSVVQATCFEKDVELLEKLTANHVRLVVLCNFQGLNNALNIVTSSRSPGYDLTPNGLADLKNETPILALYNISTIYTAPAFRALQTTNLLGKAFNLPPSQLIPDARLGMQNFGSAEGLNYTLYKQLFDSEKEMLEEGVADGESGCAVFTRIQAFLNSLANQNDQTLLIITHAFNFCHISKCLTGKYGQIPSPGTYRVYQFSKPAGQEKRK